MAEQPNTAQSTEEDITLVTETPKKPHPIVELTLFKPLFPDDIRQMNPEEADVRGACEGVIGHIRWARRMGHKTCDFGIPGTKAARKTITAELFQLFPGFEYRSDFGIFWQDWKLVPKGGMAEDYVFKVDLMKK